MSQEQGAIRYEKNEVIAAYCRVSTDSSDQLNSLDNQKSFFKHYAKDNDVKLYDTYYDEGITGTSWTKRDGFNKMLHDAGIDMVKEVNRATLKTEVKYTINTRRQPKFTKIIIKNTSRFARNTLSFALIHMLRQKGVLIYFIEQRLLTASYNDFTLKLLQNFDENDSRDKSSKVKFGFAEGAKRGKIYLGGGKLYGYDYHPKTNSLTKNKDAEVVALVYDLYVNHNMGIRVIANELKKRGHKPPKGGSEWGKTTLRNMLTNEKYAGYNPIQKFDGGTVLEDKHWPKVRDNYDIVQTDRIEPIISKEIFDKAKEIRAGKVAIYNGNRKGAKNQYGRYTKLIKCSNCGSTYIRNVDYKKKKDPTSRYYFYNCSGKKRYGTVYCKNRNVLETELDNLIKDLSYGELRKQVLSRIDLFKMWLIKLALRKIKSIDLENDVTTRVIDKKLQKEKTTLKQMYKNALTMQDDLGYIQETIAEQQKVVADLQAEYDDVSQRNQIIVDIAKSIKDEYDIISEYVDKLKKRYSEDEVLSMISCIIVQYNADDNTYILIPHYKIFERAEAIFAEHLPQLDTSKYQAAKIKDYNAFTNDLKKCYNEVTDYIECWDTRYNNN